MRPFLLVAFLLAFDWYAFQAVRTLTQDLSSSLRLSIHALYWAVPLALIAWMLGYANGAMDNLPKGIATLGRSFFFIVYLSKLLMVTLLLTDDLRRGFGFLYAHFGSGEFQPGRSRFLAQMGLALAAVPFFSLLYGIARNPYRYRLFREELRLPGLPKALDGLKIVQISDIHSGSFLHKEPVRNAVDLINAQSPDLVFFTGDLVNNKAEEALPFLDVFDKIKARYGVFSVLGNHDYGDYVRWLRPEDKTANMEQLKDIHSQMGWRLLIDEHEQVDINGEQVSVLGVGNYSAHARFPKYGNLAKAHSGSGKAALKLLLSHDPSHWEDQVVSEFPDIAMTFSGHTHGMQFGVEIPGWIKWSPIQYVYKQWAGLYGQGSQYLYVNRGLGHLGYPGRVGILPEITLIELKA